MVVLIIIVIIFFIIMKKRSGPKEYVVDEVEEEEADDEKDLVLGKKGKAGKKPDKVSVDDILSTIDLGDEDVTSSKRGKKKDNHLQKRLPKKFPKKTGGPPSHLDIGIDDGPSGIDIDDSKRKDVRKGKKGGKPPKNDLLSDLDIDI